MFSLKTYKVDHVVHGAIASAATFGAMMGATPEQIESAIGMVVAHAIPFRAIRAGTPPEMSLERAIEDQRLMDQIYSSIVER